GPGSSVQYSSDNGATWNVQETASTTEMSAGASPAPGVCWIVGKSGTVIRTVDGGRQWQRLPFPETVDLTALSASVPLSAVVTAADGRGCPTADGAQT